MFKKLLAGFIVMAFALTGAPAISSADVEVGDNLKLFGDVRIRLEADTVDWGTTAVTCGSGTDTDCDNRERPRLRARFGAKYQTPFEPVSFGLRFSTGTSLWSPHTNFGDSTIVNHGKGLDLDRGFVRFNFLESGALILGKQAYPLWQQTEQYFDSDISPEGYTLLYTASLGDMGSLTVGGIYSYIWNEGFQDSFFSNDVFPVWQVLYRGNIQGFSPTLAFTGGHIIDGDDGLEPASDPSWSDSENSFYMVSAQVKTNMNDLTLLAGFDYHFSTVDRTTGANVSDDKETGYVGQVRVNTGPYGVRYYYHNIEENSVSSYAGAPNSQDDFPSITNGSPVGFNGHRFQFDYKVAKNVGADFRIYLLDAKAGNDWGERFDINRYQLNLNAKF